MESSPSPNPLPMERAFILVCFTQAVALKVGWRMPILCGGGSFGDGFDCSF